MVSEDYEYECPETVEHNKELLSGFKDWLELKGLSEKTINTHATNIDFYINDYLLNCGCIEAKDGMDGVSFFLGDWFIRKALWSSRSAIKEYAAGLKKFYQFMYEKVKSPKMNSQNSKILLRMKCPNGLMLWTGILTKM
jgi:hypothetical protein